MDSAQTAQNGVQPSESRKLQRSDEQFISDVNAAVLMGASRSSHLILAATALFLVVALVWAANATLDEVTRGEGKVIPSSKVQVVQNLEGGIIDRILVSEGDLVERDQPLLQLDDTRFSSTFRETRLKYLALLAKSARLEAEANNRTLAGARGAGRQRGCPVRVPRRRTRVQPEYPSRARVADRSRAGRTALEEKQDCPQLRAGAAGTGHVRATGCRGGHFGGRDPAPETHRE
jgi:multidrug efflux pump subunit AcrA (membrane-fusion protein)